MNKTGMLGIGGIGGALLLSSILFGGLIATHVATDWGNRRTRMAPSDPCVEGSLKEINGECVGIAGPEINP